MNSDIFLKKIYTVAFRLTGDEDKAECLVYNAISGSYSALYLSNKITPNLFNISAKEVCRLFLEEADNRSETFIKFGKNTYGNSLQEALMSLNKLSRTTVVWKDVLGLNLEEMNLKGYDIKQLYCALNNGRSLIKNFLII